MLLHWWKNGLQLKLSVRIYPDGLLVAALYALLCLAARQISVDQFNLLAGIRVAALLLCPVRLWPYLVLGDYAHLTLVRYPMIDKYGPAWAIICSALLMPAVALIVRVQRSVLTGIPGVQLLSLAATVAIAAALINIYAAQLLWPSPPSIPLPTRAAHQTLGNFIGILTVAPLALLWLQRTALGPHQMFSIPAIALLSLMLSLGYSATQIPPSYTVFATSLQLLMALPAIALTCLHGWRGSAIAVPSLYLIVGLFMPTSGQPWSFDSATFTVQQILAVAGAALLALGSTISDHYHRYKSNTFDGKWAASLAKASHLSGEMDLRQRALDINRIGDGIDTYLSETADWLKRQGHHEIARNLISASSLYSRKFREQASMVYPTALEHVGLYLALQVGGISEAWSNTERMTQPRLIGDPCRLTVALQLATYRTLTEAVSLLLQHEPGQLRVNARCGRLGNREGILVVVTMLDPEHRLSETTCALATEQLPGRTLAYSGTVQCRRNRIRMLFVEAPDAQRAGPGASTDHTALSPTR
ncbi:MAG: MASE1 domain-containing protein [Stenotrophomonas sp.]|uniref:MASE1 domain-containing protein n=1 Tax=Stenotrophomonas sp. TaxID=69392 RepID=UPI003D6CC6E1